MKLAMSLHGTSRRFGRDAEFGRYRGEADMSGLQLARPGRE
jgi:hypothetical protein